MIAQALLVFGELMCFIVYNVSIMQQFHIWFTAMLSYLRRKFNA